MTGSRFITGCSRMEWTRKKGLTERNAQRDFEGSCRAVGAGGCDPAADAEWVSAGQGRPLDFARAPRGLAGRL